MSVEEKRQEALQAMRDFCEDNGIKNRDFIEMNGYIEEDGLVAYPIVGRADGTKFWQPGGDYFVGGYKVRYTF